jgi:hypothetical protein
MDDLKVEPAITGIILALLALAATVSGRTNIWVALVFLVTLILAILTWRKIRLEQAIEAERDKFVTTALKDLPPESIELLKRMMLVGRVFQTSDAAWVPLERANLVERDFIGPKGVKQELRMALERKLRDL